jgi:hypothetical protein
MKSVCVLTAVVLSLISKVSAAQTPLAFGFDHPQDSARTKVWWFHGETIGTHEGITADLEAFKDKGVGASSIMIRFTAMAKGLSRCFRQRGGTS